ncbi:unnamed protein product [Ectocarpus sp. 13 AM-2016]
MDRRDRHKKHKQENRRQRIYTHIFATKRFNRVACTSGLKEALSDRKRFHYPPYGDMATDYTTVQWISKQEQIMEGTNHGWVGMDVIGCLGISEHRKMTPFLFSPRK